MFEVNKLIQLKAKEKIVVVVREYGITKLPQLTIVASAYFSTLFFIYPLFRLGWWGIIVFGLVLSATIIYSIRAIIVWKTDLVIVTNQRIIDHQRQGLFSKTVREIMWAQVTDIRYSQRGMWATLWHYGSVRLLLGSTPPLDLQHVYQPETIRDILAEYVPTLS